MRMVEKLDFCQEGMKFLKAIQILMVIHEVFGLLQFYLQNRALLVCCMRFNVLREELYSLLVEDIGVAIKRLLINGKMIIEFGSVKMVMVLQEKKHFYQKSKMV